MAILSGLLILSLFLNVCFAVSEMNNYGGRKERFMKKNEGNMLHFSIDGIKWEQAAAIGMSGYKFKAVLPGNTASFDGFNFCYEYQIKIKRLPSGWEIPKLY